MDSLALILDVAHGKNIPGKQSPDGRHKEYLWSRETVRKIMHKLIDTNKLNFHPHAPYLSYENEPGLITRVKKYNDICEYYDKVLVLSLHNDAAPKSICDSKGWCKTAYGIAFWTSRGETPADSYATFMYEELRRLLPDEHFRTAYWLSEKEKVKDPDYEANFTILVGDEDNKPLYEAVLMEVLFQTNLNDVEKLLSGVWNNRFAEMLTATIIKLFKTITI